MILILVWQQEAYPVTSKVWNLIASSFQLSQDWESNSSQAVICTMSAYTISPLCLKQFPGIQSYEQAKYLGILFMSINDYTGSAQ